MTPRCPQIQPSSDRGPGIRSSVGTRTINELWSHSWRRSTRPTARRKLTAFYHRPSERVSVHWRAVHLADWCSFQWATWWRTSWSSHERPVLSAPNVFDLLTGAVGLPLIKPS